MPGAATATRSIVGRGRERIADARRRLFKPSAQQQFPQQHLDPAAASAIAAAQRVGDHAALPPLPRGRHPMYRLAFTVRLAHNNNSTVPPHLPNKAGAHTFLIWQVPWIGKKFPSWFPYFLASCDRSAYIADWLIFHEAPRSAEIAISHRDRDLPPRSRSPAESGISHAPARSRPDLDPISTRSRPDLGSISARSRLNLGSISARSAQNAEMPDPSEVPSNVIFHNLGKDGLGQLFGERISSAMRVNARTRQR